MGKRFLKCATLLRYIEIMYYNHVVIKFHSDKLTNFFKKYSIKSIEETAEILSSTEKSIGRFGDGEIAWIYKKTNNLSDFQDVSDRLSQELLRVLNSHDDDFLIGIPNHFKNISDMTSVPKKFWTMYILKNINKIDKILDEKKTYYNASVTRPYIDFLTNEKASKTFSIIKKAWNNKNILIIEGSETRLGYKNDLFSNAKKIKRIECPSQNAFNSYDSILEESLSFLNDHKDYISLIALGPTATVLSYDIFKSGFRAIDIGHIDVEYEWYLLGAKERINLPDRYVNEVSDGHSAAKINDDEFTKTIIAKIK